MPDPIPKEYLITQAIETRLKTIDGDNGFNLDFNNRVRVWETNWQIEEGHAISIFTGAANAIEAPPQRSKVQFQLPVEIEARLQATFGDEDVDTTYLTAMQAIADIKKAIGTDDKWKVDGVGLAEFTLDAGHLVLKTEGSYEIVGVQVRLTVQYIVNKWNSYE